MRAIQRAHDQTALYQQHCLSTIEECLFTLSSLALKDLYISIFYNLKDNHVLCCSGDSLSNFSVGLSLATHRNWQTTRLEHTVVREGLGVLGRPLFVYINK